MDTEQKIVDCCLSGPRLELGRLPKWIVILWLVPCRNTNGSENTKAVLYSAEHLSNLRLGWYGEKYFCPWTLSEAKIHRFVRGFKASRISQVGTNDGLSRSPPSSKNFKLSMRAYSPRSYCVESVILPARHSVSTSGASRKRVQRSTSLTQHTPSRYCMSGRQARKVCHLALVFTNIDGKCGQILADAAFHQGVLL